MGEKVREYRKKYKERFGTGIALYGLPDIFVANEDKLIEFIQKCLDENHSQDYYYPLKPGCQY